MQSVVPGEMICEGYGCLRSVLKGGMYRNPADGKRLCMTCYSCLVEGIQELPHLYAECEAMLGGPRASMMKEKASGRSRPGLALNCSVADARTQILVVLSSWSGLIAEERQFTVPSRQVPALADFLLVNLCWLAGHPAAGSLSAEIAQTRTIARRAAFPEPIRRIPVGSCVVPGCQGQLSAILQSNRPGQGTQVRCANNHDHLWGREEWIQLRREMSNAMSDSFECWRRITRTGRNHYAESDVHDSFTPKAQVSRKS